MKTVAVIGCGGINSHFVHHLAQVVKIFQQKDLIYVKLFDNDVIEEKNLLRGNQKFEVDDLMNSKSESLAKRYDFGHEDTFITEENISEKLNQFDDIIMGVDNHKTRQMIYKYCLENNKYLLDMRAQGTQMAFFVLDNTKNMDYYNKKFFSNAETMERKGSCQLTKDVETDHIENGNQIIAFMCAFGIYFKQLRNETPSTNEWQFVY